jgi:hypothetical protein
MWLLYALINKTTLRSVKFKLRIKEIVSILHVQKFEEFI